MEPLGQYGGSQLQNYGQFSLMGQTPQHYGASPVAFGARGHAPLGRVQSMQLIDAQQPVSFPSGNAVAQNSKQRYAEELRAQIEQNRLRDNQQQQPGERAGRRWNEHNSVSQDWMSGAQGAQGALPAQRISKFGQDESVRQKQREAASCFFVFPGRGG